MVKEPSLTMTVPKLAILSMAPVLSSRQLKSRKDSGNGCACAHVSSSCCGEVLLLSWPVAPLAATIGREETTGLFRASCSNFVKLG